MIDHASRRQLHLQFMQSSLRGVLSAKRGVKTGIMAPAAPVGTVVPDSREFTATMPPPSIPIVT